MQHYTVGNRVVFRLGGGRMREKAFEAEGRPLSDRACTFDGVLGKVPINALEHPLLIEGLSYWRGLCGARAYPVRSDVTPRGLKSLIQNTIIVRVIGACEDYEYRFVGDAHVVVHGQSIQGKRWSELDVGNGIFSRQRRHFYDNLVRTGEPVLVSGYVARHFFDAEMDQEHFFIHASCLCLPLGHDGTVDHILTFTVYDTKIPHVLRSDAE